jgi:transmembrane sensor
MSFIAPGEHTIVKYAVSEATRDEVEQVEYWLSLDPVNRKRLDDIRWILEESNRLSLPDSEDEEAGWFQLKQRLDNAPAKARVIQLVGRWIRVAAILILAGSAFTFYFLSRDHSQKNPVASLKIAAGNQERTDTLPDGSVVTLASHSSLQYPSRFGPGTRATTLEGEAFFSVAHDSSKPFTIIVHDIIITVRGTSFRVRSSAIKTEIIVKTGVVRVSRLGHHIELQAGEQITVLQKDSLLIKDVKDSAITKPTAIAPPKHTNIDNDPAKQKEIMLSIIQQFMSDRLAASRDSIVWFVLNEQGLIINGVKRPSSIYKKYKEKYLQYGGNGFYYGPVKITGKGFFYTKKELGL